MGLKSYLFSLGDSTNGPVGFCTRVIADSPEEALAKVKELLPECVEQHGFGRSVEYLNVYINTNAITLAAIVEGETEDEE